MKKSVHQTGRTNSTLSTLSFGRRARELPTTSSAISTHLYQTRSAEKQPFCLKFKTFLFNREKRTVCNRTGPSWFSICVYYLIYLLIIFAMFIGLTYACLSYVKKSDSPWVDKAHNWKSGGPGIYFIPNIAKTSVPLIWYSLKDYKSDKNEYVEYLEEQLQEYKALQNKAQKSTRSIYNNNTSSQQFRKEDFGPCSERNYGYSSKNPCIYLKLAKVYNWVPEYYDEPQPSMPQSLQEVILNSTSKKFVWVHCEGQKPHDKDHIESFSYYPMQGFSSEYFPYKGQENYLSPLIAVRVNTVKPGYMITVNCTPYAKNIISDMFGKSVRIVIYID